MVPILQNPHPNHLQCNFTQVNGDPVEVNGVTTEMNLSLKALITGNNYLALHARFI